MGRPPGSRNVLTRAKAAAAKRVTAKHVDPLESILQRRDHLVMDREELLLLRHELMAAPSRHRRVKKIAQIDATIDRLDKKILMYDRAAMPGALDADETDEITNRSTRTTVIRYAEEPAKKTEDYDPIKWAEKHVPPEFRDRDREPIKATGTSDGIYQAGGLYHKPEPVDPAPAALKSAPDVIADLDRKFLEAYK